MKKYEKKFENCTLWVIFSKKNGLPLAEDYMTIYFSYNDARESIRSLMDIENHNPFEIYDARVLKEEDFMAEGGFYCERIVRLCT